VIAWQMQVVCRLWRIMAHTGLHCQPLGNIYKLAILSGVLLRGLANLHNTLPESGPGRPRQHKKVVRLFVAIIKNFLDSGREQDTFFQN
jgi:hypothetical protein